MGYKEYRVIVQYDGEIAQFIARAPELDNLQAVGETREEAVSRLDEEICAIVSEAVQSGKELPKPLDQALPKGPLTLNLSPTLQQELLGQAQMEGVSVSQLLTEILASGLEWRKARGKRHERGKGERERGDRGGDRGQTNDRRDRGPSGRRYFDIMEDRANFIDYVRRQDGRGRNPRKP